MRTVFRSALVILLFSLLIGVLPSVAAQPARAQTGNDVTYDVAVEGAITEATFSEDWTLVAPAADRITIRVERVDGNLVPSVRLLDNNGQEIANSYGADRTYAAAEIKNFTLPLPLTYTVRVERRDGENGNTTGRYSLEVSLEGAASDSPANSSAVGPVEFDTPVTGDITAQHWWHEYTLEGEAGDYVAVRAQRSNGVLVPEVRLLDSNGQELTRGYSTSLGDTAAINGFELPYTGQYTVVVYRIYEITGDTTGGYELTVELLGSSEEGSRLAAVTPGVFDQYNTTQTGSITGAGWYEDWQFRTEGNDTITVVARRAPSYTLAAPNNLAPTVLLLDESGNELTRGYVDYNDAHAMINRFTLPGAGQYTVRVTRDGLKTGLTTGTYAVELILNGTGIDSPILGEPAGLITVGEPVTGTLDAARWMHIWTFEGQEGQQISVEVVRTDGTLVPYLEIRDSNGQYQTYAYADNTFDAARINQYTLGYTGEYQIVIMRDGNQAGETGGGYRLTVQ